MRSTSFSKFSIMPKYHGGREHESRFLGSLRNLSMSGRQMPAKLWELLRQDLGTGTSAAGMAGWEVGYEATVQEPNP